MFKLMLKHPGAVIGAVILHLLVIALFFMSFDWTDKPDIKEEGLPVVFIDGEAFQTPSNVIAPEDKEKQKIPESLKEDPAKAAKNKQTEGTKQKKNKGAVSA